MHKSGLKHFFILLCFSILSGSVLAQTAYVTDQFKVTMRSGESAKHKITRMLATGTAVRVEKVNKKSGYSEVVTNDGTHGYVLTRQLLNEPVARERLAQLKLKIQKLEAAPSQLQKSLSDLTEQHNQLKSAHETLTEINNKMEQELKDLKYLSSNAVKVSEERNRLRRQVAQMTEEQADLKQQNRELQNNTTQRWFMIGAGAIILGILLGLILPHMRFRNRQKDWGTL